MIEEDLPDSWGAAPRIIGLSMLLCFAALASNSLAQENRSTPLGPDTAVPANSRSMYEFRGTVGFTYGPYQALFRTRTYGQLRFALEEFFRHWKSDGRTFEDSSSKNMFLRCRLALIRTYYLLGDTEEADTLLEWMHPATLLDETGFPAKR